MNGRVNGRASEDNNEMYINKQTKKKENKKTYKYTYTLYIRYRKFIQKKKNGTKTYLLHSSNSDKKKLMANNFKLFSSIHLFTPVAGTLYPQLALSSMDLNIWSFPCCCSNRQNMYRCKPVPCGGPGPIYFTTLWPPTATNPDSFFLMTRRVSMK